MPNCPDCKKESDHQCDMIGTWYCDNCKEWFDEND